MQTLEEFIRSEKARLEAFETYWRAAHAIAPNAYELSMEDGNEGMWIEALAIFDEEDDLPTPGELEPVPEGYVAPAPIKRSPRR